MHIANLDFVSAMPIMPDSHHAAAVKGGLTVQAGSLAIALGSQLATTFTLTQTWALKLPII